MKTQIFKNEIGNTPEIIRNGGLVAVPTETVYGLAGNGLDESAVQQIYDVKNRPEVKPLSLMVSGSESIERFCVDVPTEAFAFAEQFWPGPLTLILKAKEEIPSIVLAGGNTVGLRCPDSPLTLQLIRESGCPLAAPSANISGQKSPKCAEDVLSYFKGKIDAVIDGGTCNLGIESTILDLTNYPFRILRRGALQMPIIGITGQTGSGKTTALHELQSVGGFVIDCDALYHDLLNSDAGLRDAIEESFPGTVHQGVVDRKLLASRVFQNPEQLELLNRITHRFVYTAVLKEILRAGFSGCRLIAVDAVELISSGLSRLCDCTIGITAEEGVRCRRIMTRDSLSEEEALARIRAQRPASYYEEFCDVCIDNNADELNFIKKVKEVLNHVRFER